ncbi:MAG: EAL domain-containing protein [Nocardioides sp.]|nr:EAL domain-containing protein [Nocardioides sp.]
MTAALEEQLSQAQAAGEHLVLVGATVSNGVDIVDAHGPSALAMVTDSIGERLARHPGARLLHVSALGGVITAVRLSPDRLGPDLIAIEQQLRGFVRIGARRIWPVVTAGTLVCGPEGRAVDALEDLRATLFATDTEAPGTTRRRHEPSTGSSRERLGLVSDLAETLQLHREQIALAYQPVVDLDTGAVVGAEALLRWHHPTRGHVSPLDAVVAAESSGLIHTLGLHVLELALVQSAPWRARASGSFSLHVNVSPHQLNDPAFVTAVTDLLGAHDVAPHELLLELTESELMLSAWTMAALTELRTIDVRLGIDDFGTGYSSIAHLHRLPVDTVKIDRSLVADIDTSPRAVELLSAVVRLLDTSPVAVVVEGVETPQQAAHLRAMGCRFAQGYHLGRPAPADAFPHSRLGPLSPVASMPPGSRRMASTA